MKRLLAIYFIGGVFAGLVTVVIGSRFPAVLAVGTGPIFGIVVVLCLALSKPQLPIARPILKYSLVFAICICSYVLSLTAFSIAMGYSPDFGNVARSNDILEFRADVWIGLVAAIFVASIGMELAAKILIGKWSNGMLLRFIVAGLSAALVAYVCSLVARSYWSLLGALIPLGEGAFACLLGYQLLRSSVQSKEA